MPVRGVGWGGSGRKLAARVLLAVEQEAESVLALAPGRPLIRIGPGDLVVFAEHFVLSVQARSERLHEAVDD